MTWTGWILAVALPWWQHHKHCLGIIIIINYCNVIMMMMMLYLASWSASDKCRWVSNKTRNMSNSESVQCNFFIFDYETFIQFKICCCVQNLIKIGWFFTSSSRMRVMNHNWSAMKQHLHPQSVAEISRHSVLSGDRIRQCETSSGSRQKDTDQCL